MLKHAISVLVLSVAFATMAAADDSVSLHCVGLKNVITGEYPNPINIEIEEQGQWIRPGAGTRMPLFSQEANLWNYGDWTDRKGYMFSFLPEDLGLTIYHQTNQHRSFYCIPFTNPFAGSGTTE